MANIRENKKGGKTVSYRFTVYLEKDMQDKQIRRYTTWTPPDCLTPSKALKAAERAADIWEQEVKAEYLKEKAAKQCGLSYSLPPEKRKDDFITFVRDTWFTLYICNGDRKQSTIHFYEIITQSIVTYFKGAILLDISPIHIQQYLQHIRIWLRCRTLALAAAK